MPCESGHNVPHNLECSAKVKWIFSARCCQIRSQRVCSASAHFYQKRIDEDKECTACGSSARSWWGLTRIVR